MGKEDHSDLIEEINSLKQKKKAVILVHNYQRSEIYDVADFIGDSLGLCQQAAATDAEIILFCGVNFMAESAAILNPGKKVIMPFLDAGCAMADMADADGLKAMKRKYPEAAVVCYVNSSAEIKAESDVCCTSSNAVKVVRSLKSKQVIFVPDQNLAKYVALHTPDKEIIAWQGYCPMHHAVTRDYLKEAISTYPKAKIIAHPESRPEVLAEADYVSSTSGMIQVAKDDDAEEFFVLTECGMTERLRREVPGKKFHGLCNLCFDMKKNTLEAILRCLKEESPVVKVDRKIATRALRAFENMFAIK